MFCEHKRLKSVNCVLYCADCGEQMPVQSATGGPPEILEPPTQSASGRKIGFEAEKKTAPKRRKKGGNET